jgi:putative FmdB family regulatory protein
MPLYDFRCHECGTEFEAMAPVGGTAACPKCGAEQTERLLRPFAGPFTIRPRGIAAKRADAARRVKEEQRLERKAARQEARRQGES